MSSSGHGLVGDTHEIIRAAPDRKAKAVIEGELQDVLRNRPEGRPGATGEPARLNAMELKTAVGAKAIALPRRQS